MDDIFLDTNIFIRFLTKDDPQKAEECLNLFEAIIDEKIVARTSIINISEICYVLNSKKSGYNLPRYQIVEKLLTLLNLKNITLNEKEICINTLLLYRKYKDLDFEDAYIVAYMNSLRINNLCSYDTDFNRVKEINRLTPVDLSY